MMRFRKALDAGFQMLRAFWAIFRIITKDIRDLSYRPNIKTIKELCKKIKVKNRKVLIIGEETFLRLLAINSYTRVPLQRLMTFKNALVPLPSSMKTERCDRAWSLILCISWWISYPLITWLLSKMNYLQLYLMGMLLFKCYHMQTQFSRKHS